MNKLQKLIKDAKKNPETAKQILDFKQQVELLKKKFREADNDSLGAFYNLVVEIMDERKLLEPSPIMIPDIKDYLIKATENEITQIQKILQEEINRRKGK